MTNKLTKLAIFFVLLLSLSFIFIGETSASPSDSGSINEKFGKPIVVYGDALTDAQKEKVRELVNVDDPSMVKEVIVTAEDLVNYLGDGNPNSNMYSSAKITRKEEGNGLVINIVTADNITEVTNEMYSNALLTAGIENAVVDVASPVKVSGHSALTGIYKAYDAGGEKLDQARMEVASEELDVATNLADKEGLNQEKVSELLTGIKQDIAEQNPASKEDIEKIVQDQLDKLEIELSPEDRQMLVNLFEKMRSIDINFDNVKDQLDSIAGNIKDKIEEVAGDEGFWRKVGNFFEALAKGIVDFIKGLFM